MYPKIGYNNENKVDLSKVEKSLKRVPQEIVIRLMKWIRTVEEFGLSEARRVKGYHDEPLKGLRYGQRSIRLGIKWRAIYTQSMAKEINIVMIEEITPHDYRTK
jgi:proteic killer suppression protein